MKTERSYIRLYILFTLLLLFVIFYVVSKEEKKESSVENISYSMNLILDTTEKEEIKEEEIVIEEEPTKTVEQHSGDLTGYSADCPKCYGTLACKPNYKVYKNGVVTYNDKDYGNVRIVATSKKVPCGSIIKFNDTYAIVLDRGVLGYNVDLLVESEEYARVHVGRKKITYDIVRRGW